MKIGRFVNIFITWSNEYVIPQRNDYYPMETVMEEKVVFEFYPEARYITDVISKQSNRLAGNISENKRLFSGKHHPYGIKTGVSVLTN